MPLLKSLYIGVNFKMRKLFFLSVQILVFFSCTVFFSCIDHLNDIEDDNKVKIVDPILKTVPLEFDALGYGYDIMGDYLATTSIRRPVLDVNKLKANRPNDILVYTGTSGYSVFSYGEDAYSYIKDVSKDFNLNLSASSKEKTFSGTISLNSYFNDNYSYSTKYSFASCDVTKCIKRIKLDIVLSNLLDYLDPTFIVDINNLSADLLVEKYGTHVLIDFSVGGRLKLIYKSAIINVSNSTTKKDAIKAGFNVTIKMVNLAADATVSNQTIETYKSSNTDKSLYVQYYGGEGSGMSYNLENGTPSLNVNSWESSVNINNCALVDVNWTTTYAIYDFISNSSKKAEIKAAVERHIEKNKISVLKLTPMYKLFNNGIKDTFYEFGYDKAVASGSIIEGVVGYVLVEQNPDTKPIYKLFNNDAKDTFYMFDYNQAISSGSRFEGFTGVYALSQSDNNTIPVYKLFNKNIKDTFYMFDYNQAISSGSKFEGFTGVYIYK
ncbi:hypothetical protein FACS1894174_08920 [Bacteroidia bacterium]|nr:hypothetical protein FACS1894174_08920 [Bacteroidia bacterium]